MPQLNRSIHMLQEGRVNHLNDLIPTLQSINSANTGAVNVIQRFSALHHRIEEHHRQHQHHQHHHHNQNQQQGPAQNENRNNPNQPQPRPIQPAQQNAQGNQRGNAQSNEQVRPNP